MECIVLAGSEEAGLEMQYRLEDLGEEWRCCTLTGAEAALQRMRRHYTGLLILTDCPAASALVTAMSAQPLLSPPWTLGWGRDAPDGRLTEISALPRWLQMQRMAGALPSLSGLRLPEVRPLAEGLLHALGVRRGLGAWRFLPEMAALTAVHPPLLTDLQHRLYPMAAALCGMTPPAVERSLRLCVESTWSRGSLEALERFFGSSVDPERGKPTNREFLCRVQERLTLAAERLERA